MARKKLLFKKPTIIRNKSGEWHVQYSYLNPDTLVWERFKERKGINYLKDPDEKERAAVELCAQVLAWLKEGHSPYDDLDKAERKVSRQLAPLQQEVQNSKSNKKAWTIARAIEKYIAYIEKQGLDDVL